MRIVERPREITIEEWHLCYWFKDHYGNWGFAFDCDKEGNVDESKLNSAALENWNRCRDEKNKDEFCDSEIRYSKRRIYVPATGKCECGGLVELGGFTNTCEKCGRDYNWAGQLLAPREQWGEETGEHASDILRIR